MTRTSKVLKRLDNVLTTMDSSSLYDTIQSLKQVSLLLVIIDDEEHEDVKRKLDLIEEYLDLVENKVK